MSASGKRALDVLLSAQKNGRLHHAILLYGADLAELESVAKTLAAQILKMQNVAKHPDLFELRPEGKMRQIKIGSDADRTGGEWPPNSMRRLLHELRQSSNQGAGKVAIIYEADRMNIPTANAFLKTLEEPSRDTTIILLTQRVNDLLDTIRSRCINMRVDCPVVRLEDADWREWLADYCAWIGLLSKGIGKELTAGGAVMRCYALLSRFDAILTRLTDEKSDISEESAGELADDLLDAIVAGERRALRKKLLAEIEEGTVESALGALGGEKSAPRLARALEELEKCSGFMELNMQDAPALEYFMLASLKIWAAK